MDDHFTPVTHNTCLKVDTQFKVGTLIKFWYESKIPRGTIQTQPEKRFSYSKITKVIPKINERNFIRLHYVTENEKFIEESQIVSVERKADD